MRSHCGTLGLITGTHFKTINYILRVEKWQNKKGLGFVVFRTNEIGGRAWKKRNAFLSSPVDGPMATTTNLRKGREKRSPSRGNSLYSICMLCFSKMYMPGKSSWRISFNTVSQAGVLEYAPLSVKFPNLILCKKQW